MRKLLILPLLFGAGPLHADVSPFKTPSDNIHCTIGVGDGPPDLSCTIHERNGPPAAARPNNCQGAWGHHFILLPQGQTQMRCGAPGAKNTAPGVDIAQYGEHADWGGISCSSSRRGLECQNMQGHGFFLSRSRQSLY